ncbi:uncharacterized protein LOC134562662 [Prinia subflava]|uniref:uncharacterized protein LOC134562662 n=1 Tax=Prinia subflava TaxID=208062 RepID=UPI002FE16DCB
MRGATAAHARSGSGPAHLARLPLRGPAARAVTSWRRVGSARGSALRPPAGATKGGTAAGAASGATKGGTAAGAASGASCRCDERRHCSRSRLRCLLPVRRKAALRPEPPPVPPAGATKGGTAAGAASGASCRCDERRHCSRSRLRCLLPVRRKAALRPEPPPVRRKAALQPEPPPVPPAGATKGGTAAGAASGASCRGNVVLRRDGGGLREDSVPQAPRPRSCRAALASPSPSESNSQYYGYKFHLKAQDKSVLWATCRR